MPKLFVTTRDGSERAVEGDANHSVMEIRRGGGGDGGTNINIASIVALAPEILDGMYGGVEDGAPSLDRGEEK